MQKELSARIATSGFLILSGILKKKAEEVTEKFSCNLKFYREMNYEEWTCLVFQNKKP
jgi:ribosomal protein L11 methylase PrmA